MPSQPQKNMLTIFLINFDGYFVPKHLKKFVSGGNFNKTSLTLDGVSLKSFIAALVWQFARGRTSHNDIVTSINLSATSKHLTLLLYANKNLISNMIDDRDLLDYIIVIVIIIAQLDKLRF